jgi:hypothetical protein
MLNNIDDELHCNAKKKGHSISDDGGNDEIS